MSIEGRQNAIASKAIFYDRDYVERIIKENAELKAKLDKAVEALRFYADTEKWNGYHLRHEMMYEEDHEDIFINPREGSISYAGKRARQALKEIENE